MLVVDSAVEHADVQVLSHEALDNFPVPVRYFVTSLLDLHQAVPFDFSSSLS